MSVNNEQSVFIEETNKETIVDIETVETQEQLGMEEAYQTANSIMQDIEEDLNSAGLSIDALTKPNKKNRKSSTVKTKNKVKKSKSTKSIKIDIKKMKAKLAKQRKESSLCRQIAYNWKKLMAYEKIYNVIYDTYTLTNMKVKPYGVEAYVRGVTGLPISLLSKYIPVIEGEFNCKFVIDDDLSDRTGCNVTFLNTKLNYNTNAFKPYKVKPYELYWGVNEKGEPVISNVNKAPHTLIAGQTGKGKNGALDHAVLSLITYTDPKEAQLILLEGAKSDLVKFAFSPHTQAYISDYNQMSKIMAWIAEEIKRRIKLLMPMIANIEGDNLFDYNKNAQNKLPYIYVVVDEFLGLMTGTKDTEQARKYIIDVLCTMAQIGRSVGVVYVVCHQKPEKQLMPTFLKNMTSTRICFGFNDAVCSQIVLGNDDAHKLPERRAIYLAETGEQHMLYTTDLRLSSKDIIYMSREKCNTTPFLQAKVLGPTSFSDTVGISVQKLLNKEKMDEYTRNTSASNCFGVRNANVEANSSVTAVTEEEAKRHIQLLLCRHGNKGIKTKINSEGKVLDDIDYDDIFED
ncbi:FtsK/SpoIIIE domain-containing protein [Clostridium tertium]|uniref:FtsK/SpoIIIE domain-containing protein n=1 Tax=Clostridium tertium TaxID=1559 RepID=UPI0023B32221|nr:FtsK/SpoIIIE domain-containing protein [Clostridium tertium]